MGNSKKKPDTILKDRENIVSDMNIVSEKFIQYFSNVALKLDSDLGQHVGEPIRHIPSNIPFFSAQ